MVLLSVIWCGNLILSEEGHHGLFFIQLFNLILQSTIILNWSKSTTLGGMNMLYAILFLLIGLKLEMSMAYFVILGIATALTLVRGGAELVKIFDKRT